MHTKTAGTIKPAGSSWYFFSGTGGGIGGMLGVVGTEVLIFDMPEEDCPGGNWSGMPGGPGSVIGIWLCAIGEDKCVFSGEIDWEDSGNIGGGGGGGGTPG